MPVCAGSSRRDLRKMHLWASGGGMPEAGVPDAGMPAAWMLGTGTSGRARRPVGGVPAVVSGALLLLFPIALLILFLGSGCATRRPVAGPGPIPIPSSPAPLSGQVETTVVPGAIPSEPDTDASPSLPGADRVYPSQDPRNRVNPDAPEAFPLRAGVAGQTAEGMLPQGSAAGASGPITEGTLPGGSAAGEPSKSLVWSVQLLASGSAAIARERAGALAPYFDEAPRVVPAAGLFRVRVGHCAARDEAEAVRRKAVDLGLRDAFVVPAEASSEPPR